eukprot:gnl/TRDRNA2_/TRDRNA2_176563_c0_seq1.p1 gnl/TRDRNA2_/TRDRNA2_176563_c0~~gnl/TRDRNA2_/TRDRNA2_176563_c0_seq1.p1  ORF type:complete len:406 (-),score=-39.91 gnl/TRDRNA2_/TRDRNA2_176563_c0_seq1:56-1273(-)
MNSKHSRLNGKNYRNQSFKDLGIQEKIILRLKTMHLFWPTEFQKKLIPKILKRSSALGVTYTGSGKTIASVLPMIQIIEKSNVLSAILLTHTKELAYRVYRQFSLLSHHGTLKTHTYSTNFNKMMNSDTFTWPHFIAATPGTLAKLLNTGYLKENLNLNLIVIDEADNILKPILQQVMSLILRRISMTNVHHQTILFTTTLNPSINELKKRLLHKTYYFRAYGSSHVTRPLSKYLLFMSTKMKEAYLDSLIRKMLSSTFRLLVVFVNNDRQSESLLHLLKEIRFSNCSFHTDKRWIKEIPITRDNVKVLVTTNRIFSDSDAVKADAIINYDLPDSAQVYLERIQKLCPTDRHSHCFSFVTPRDSKRLFNLEYSIGKIQQGSIKKEVLLPSILRVYKAKEAIYRFH